MTETALTVFEKAEFGQIRVLARDGEPWFVAADVCRVLEIQNAADTLAKVLDEDEKGIDNIYTPGGPQKMATVTEAGLYALIFKSRKREANAFRRWVTHEVLPAIRKTGTYALPAAPAAPPAPKPITKAQLQVVNAFYNIAKIEHNQKLLALDRLIHKGLGISPLEEAGITLTAPVQDRLLTPTQIGNALNPRLSAQSANKLLERLGFQHKVAGEWVPCESVEKGLRGQVCDAGKKHGSGAPVTQIKWPTAIVAAIQGKAPNGLFNGQGGAQ